MKKKTVFRTSALVTLGAIIGFNMHDPLVRLRDYLPPKPQVEVGEHPHPYSLQLKREKNRQGTEVYLYDPVTDEKVQVFDHLYTGDLEHRYHALRAAGGNLKSVLDYENFWESTQNATEGVREEIEFMWKGLKKKVGGN